MSLSETSDDPTMNVSSDPVSSDPASTSSASGVELPSPNVASKAPPSGTGNKGKAPSGAGASASAKRPRTESGAGSMPPPSGTPASKASKPAAPSR